MARKRPTRASSRAVAAARAAYIRGDGILSDLARKDEMPAGTLYKIAREEDWSGARNDAVRAGVRKAAEQAAEAMADRASRLLGLSDRMIEAAERGLDQGRGYTDTSRALRDATQALLQLRAAIGRVSPGDLAEPDARIEKLRAETEQLEHRDEGQTVRVVFEADGDDYAG